MSQSLADEMRPLDFAEADFESEWWLVAFEVDGLETQMAGSCFWARTSRGRQFRAEALDQALAVIPRARALRLPGSASVLEEVVRLLTTIDRR
jgi:hypothetical protein